MNEKLFGDVKFSRLMLGTAQFGLPYGVANKIGQPSPREILEILKCAHEGGINCLDTAATYGESEERIGQALAELGIASEMIVVTKVCALADNLSSKTADAIVEQSVVNSLKKLRLETLPFCLFHREENFRYVESLQKLQARGLVQYIGCSMMTTAPAVNILGSGLAAALQIPANLFDHRFRKLGVLPTAREQNVAIFVRSIYLQGLLLMPDADIPAELAQVIPLRHKLHTLAREAGIEMSALAARYILSLEGVTCAVVGVESVLQMRENLELFSAGPLPDALVAKINEIIPEMPNEILLPNLWSKRMPDVAPAK